MPEDASQIPDLPSPPPEDRQAATDDYGAELAELRFKTAQNVYDRAVHDLTVDRSMLTQRKIYAGLLLLVSCCWLWFIGSYLYRFGEVTTANPPTIKPVSDTVIVALITTTTINVIGLFYVVARWLFPQPPAPKSEK